jgi:hypothetical protein
MTIKGITKRLIYIPVIGLAVDDVTSLTGLKFGKSGEVVVGFLVVVGRVVSVVRCVVVGLVVVVVVIVVIMVDCFVGKVVEEVVDGLAVVVEVVDVVTYMNMYIELMKYIFRERYNNRSDVHN